MVVEKFRDRLKPPDTIGLGMSVNDLRTHTEAAMFAIVESVAAANDSLTPKDNRH